MSNSFDVKRTAIILLLITAMPSPVVAGSAPVRIAVLDSGLWQRWAAHPEFSSTKLVAWHDFQDRSPTPIDPVGHGTAVASLAVGTTLGTAPEAELIVGRVLDSANRTTWNVVVRGIDWAVENKADVINVSIWSAQLQPLQNRAISEAISRARAAGAITVWIAGNGHDVEDSPMPATVLVGGSSPNALVVGSASPDGRPSPWSRTDPEVLAVGEDVTAAAMNLAAPYAGGWIGTSFAAPRIAGALARLISEGAPREPDWLEWVILHEALDNEEIDYLHEGYGVFGETSLANALNVARGERSVPPPDARDAFHLSTAAARAGLTASAPSGILPP